MIPELRNKASKVSVPVVLGVVTVVFSAAVYAWAGTSSNTAVKKPISDHARSAASPGLQPAETAPQAAAPKMTIDVAQVKAYLTAGTDYYVQLFQQAQQALGTTQYADAYAGIAALDDPTSAASMWSEYQQKFMKADYSAMMTTTYNQVSNVYTAASVDTPSAVNDWNDGINQAFSDIGPWMSDATSWQISGIRVCLQLCHRLKG
jgi:hypothetical protein